jgi:hypothetical protein
MRAWLGWTLVKLLVLPWSSKGGTII